MGDTVSMSCKAQKKKGYIIDLTLLCKDLCGQTYGKWQFFLAFFFGGGGVYNENS